MDFDTDRELWEAAASNSVPNGTAFSHWGFSRGGGPSTTFQLTVCSQGPLKSAVVSLHHAPMLVAFDLSYWTALEDSKAGLDERRTRCFWFLHKLRKRVEAEILSADPDLPNCDTLKCWAARAVRGKNHYNEDASELLRAGAYSELPDKAAWSLFLISALRYMSKEIEIHLQEGSSDFRTGQPDSLSFALKTLGLEDAMKRNKLPLPYKPGKDMPELLSLGRKRGLSASALTDMSKRARTNVLQGLDALREMVDPYRGKEIPNRVETVQWKNGLVTCLPWTRGYGGETWDQDTVHRMAKAPDVRDSISLAQDQFLVLGTPRPHEPSHHNDKQIREALGNGRCVVLTGEHLDGPSSMSKEDILAWRGSLQHKIECLDAHLIMEAHTKPAKNSKVVPKTHKEIKLADFLEKRKPTDCLNGLDLPVFNNSLNQPSVITRISDNVTALALTAKEQFTALSVDNWKLSSWNLVTHPGFVTDAHKDANGLCTWIYPHQGLKIWCVLKPSQQPGERDKEKLFAEHRTMLAPKGDKAWESNSSMYTIFLAPGDLFIMPPGKWHQVYTPTLSYVSGGHFYTLESLHLTEFSRAFDHLPGGELATNAENDVLRVLCRMAMALPLLQADRILYRKPMVALAKMILNHEDYISEMARLNAEDAADAMAGKSEEKELVEKEVLMDLDAAKRIMGRVLKVAGDYELEYGIGWELCGPHKLSKIST